MCRLALNSSPNASVPYKGNFSFHGTTSFPTCNRSHLLTSSLHWFFLDLFLSLHTRGLSLYHLGNHVITFKFHLWNPHQQPFVPVNLPHEAYGYTSGLICTLLSTHSTSWLFQYLLSHVLKTFVQRNMKMLRSSYLKGGNEETEGSLSP